MRVSAYEGVVGWRYLIRPRARPLVLMIGLITLVPAAGIAAYFGGADASRNLFTDDRNVAWIVQVVAGSVAAVGGCITIFGLLNTFQTTFSAFGSFMVTIGVAEVILVLGVMNGFQADLRSKIIDTHAHVVIEPIGTPVGLPDYRSLAAQARVVEGVVGASPFVNTEVMLSSRSNLAAAMLQGIDIQTVGQAGKLPETLKRGRLEALENSALVESFELRHPPNQALIDELEALQAKLEARQADAERAQPPKTGLEDANVSRAQLETMGLAIPMPKPGASRHPASLILGAELRRNLNVWPGEVVNVVSPYGELGPTGPVPKSRPYRVAGWFESGMLEFDTKLAYGSLSAVQRYMGVADVVSGIQVRVAVLEEARQVRDRLQAVLGSTVRVTDWQERNRNLFSALKLEKVVMFLVLTINILLAAFSITGTLVMTVLERQREIAILRTLGATAGAIIRIFVAQGAFVGVLGSLLGASLGLAGGLVLAKMGLPMDPEVYYISAIPIDVRAVDVVSIIAVALLVCVISTIYPALYASRLRPLEGLAGE